MAIRKTVSEFMNSRDKILALFTNRARPQTWGKQHLRLWKLELILVSPEGRAHLEDLRTFLAHLQGEFGGSKVEIGKGSFSKTSHFHCHPYLLSQSSLEDYFLKLLKMEAQWIIVTSLLLKSPKTK